MIFTKTALDGAYLIDLAATRDHRGFFARTWCNKEFTAHGLNAHLAQCNISYNTNRGTLRGLHYQIAPHEEAKTVFCISGAIYDVIIDLRKHSPTYCQWQAFELSLKNPKLLYIPEGFAHGFQTLQPETTVVYQMSEFYHPECARGIRWDDPSLNICWPMAVSIISDKDAKCRDFKP